MRAVVEWDVWVLDFAGNWVIREYEVLEKCVVDCFR